MTNQEMFDAVVAHARKQKCQAMRGNLCCYRGPNKTKCFIGALIPDDKYRKEFEGRGLSLAVSDAAGIEKEQYNFAAQLQETHDTFDVSQWEERFKDIALICNLTYTPPTA